MRLLLLLVLLFVSESKANEAERERLTERKLECLKCKFKKRKHLNRLFSIHTRKESNASNKRQHQQTLFFRNRETKNNRQAETIGGKKLSRSLENEMKRLILLSLNTKCLLFLFFCHHARKILLTLFSSCRSMHMYT